MPKPTDTIIPREKLSQIYASSRGATLIEVLGFSSLGKSTSLMTLPPAHTYMVLVAKDPPFPLVGYTPDEKVSGKEGNLAMSHDPLKIRAAMSNVSNHRPEVDYFIIDDGTYIMTQEFMDKANVTGWDKFTQMAANLWQILRQVNTLRPTLKVIFIGHLDEEMGKEGSNSPLVMKTIGKLTREKLTPEGLTNIILVPSVQRLSEEGQARYWFYTQSDGVNPARSPLGMFPYRVKNDMYAICQRIDEYYAGIPLEESSVDLEMEVVEQNKPSKRRTL